MSEPVKIPQHFFKAKCQNPDCRTLLGGFHVPCDGGLIVYACQKCGQTSVFRNEKFGINAVLAGPIVEHGAAAAAAGLAGQRRR